MSEGFLGEVRMIANNYAPRNWALCHGQLLPIAQNQALYALLGTTYGGDGRTSFALPDLRGRCVMGSGSVPGGVYKQRGMMAGNDFTTLSTSELPPHAHPITDATVTQNLTATGKATIKCQNTPGNSQSPEGKLFAATKERGGDQIYGDGTDQTMKDDIIDINVPVTGDVTVTGHTSSVGAGRSFSNLPPFGCIDYMICIDGIFPPRPD